ncbi:MAG: ferredoxin [bacterium]
MADPTKKLAKNVPGVFYVDETCIDCEVCREIATDNFTRDNALRKSYVFTQPDNPADEAACLAAMDECPVEAIGRE